MRSEIGTFSRILMEVFVFFFLLFYSSYVKGEGNTCKLQATGECTNAIITIDKKSAEEETSFNVYIHRQWIRELAAVLIYDNVYICHKTNGFKCTSLPDGSFNVTLGCETLQNVTLVGDGQQPIRCQPTNNSKDSNCCRHQRESGNSVDGSRQKRCPCPNALPENPDEKPNNRIEDDNGGKMDNTKENGSLVIVISLISSISAVVLFVALCYHKRIVRRCKKDSNEHIYKEYAYTEAPLNSEITKC